MEHNILQVFLILKVLSGVRPYQNLMPLLNWTMDISKICWKKTYFFVNHTTDHGVIYVSKINFVLLKFYEKHGEIKKKMK